MKVALTTDPHHTDTNCYEVVIGGWQGDKSCIRRGVEGQILTIIDDPTMISCDEMR